VNPTDHRIVASSTRRPSDLLLANDNGPLCCRGRAQIVQLPLDFLVCLHNQFLIVTKRRQRLPQGEHVLWAVVTLERFRHGIFATLHASMAEPSQGYGISFTSKDHVQYSEATYSGDVIQDTMNLNVHLIKSGIAFAREGSEAADRLVMTSAEECSDLDQETARIRASGRILRQLRRRLWQSEERSGSADRSFDIRWLELT
jgi:hypothetical protein